MYKNKCEKKKRVGGIKGKASGKTIIGYGILMVFLLILSNASQQAAEIPIPGENEQDNPSLTQTKTSEPMNSNSMLKQETIKGGHNTAIDTNSENEPVPTGSVTVWSEDFEGSFPGSWNVGDSDTASGEDYWDDTSYRSYSGLWSGWSADIGTQASTTTIFTEDFEGAFPGSWVVGDSDSGSGADYWDDTSYRSYAGGWSAWSADIGTQSVSTTILFEDFEDATFPQAGWSTGDYDSNSGLDYWDDRGNGQCTGDQDAYNGAWQAYVADMEENCRTTYDDDMESYMTYGPFSLSGYASALINYYLWLDIEDFFDYLYLQASPDGNSWTTIATYSSGYDSVDGDPLARIWGAYSNDLSSYAGDSSVWIRFFFTSDGSITRDGAYVDDIWIRGYKTNAAERLYDNDMFSYMYRDVTLSSYSSVSLTYYYWIDSESGFDRLYVSYYSGGSWSYIDMHQGNSGGWLSSTVAIPTTATKVGFLFESDSSVRYEGAYIDNVVLVGTSQVPNAAINKYDNDMDAYMYRSASLSPYSSVTLSYYYWIDSESGFDYSCVIYWDGSWNYIDQHSGNSGGWQFSSVSIPTTATDIGFHFYSDSTVSDYEGAYLDEISLVGIIPTYSVTIDSNPPNRDIAVDGIPYAAPQTFSWDSGTTHTIGTTSPQTVGSTRYVWTSWSDGGAQTHSITVTGPNTYTANFNTEHEHVISTSPSGRDFTIDGFSYSTPQTVWWVSGSSHTIGTNTPQTLGTTRYVFSSWSDGGAITHLVSPTMAIDFTANFNTQYYLTCDSPHGTTSGSGWFDSGTSAMCSVSPTTVPGTSGTQYVFTQWTGDASGSGSTSNPITMNAPKTGTANWKTQYELICSSTHGTATGSGWYDSGTSAACSVSPTAVSGGPGTQYIFTQWTGDASGSGSTSNPITMNAPKTGTANWKTQYELVCSSPYGTVTGSGWYDSGTSATCSVSPTTVSGGSGTQYIFTQWTGDTSGSGSTSNPITMNAPKTGTASWKTQFELTVESSPISGINVYINGAPTPTGTTNYQSWFDMGSIITVEIEHTVSQGGNTYTFEEWMLPGGGTSANNPISITLDNAKTITANYLTTNPDFEISATPDIQFAAPGSSTTYSVALTSLNGYSSSVSLSASGLPGGAVPLFSPASVNPTGTSTLTISTTPTVSEGTYSIIITGTDGALTHTYSVTLIITSQPDFQIGVTPDSQTTSVGGETTYTVTITSLNGYTSPSVSLSMSGEPSGVSSTFSPVSVSPTETSLLTITTTSSVLPGSYMLIVTANNGTVSHSCDITLIISSQPDFTIAVTPITQTTYPGGDVSYTITLASLNAYSSSVSLSISGLPESATSSCNPSSVTPTGSSTLTITTTSTEVEGSYVIRITGTDGTMTHYYDVALVIAIIDTDNDGLPDDWENQYFGNLDQGPNEDPDDDGKTNLQEYNDGTNPNNKDDVSSEFPWWLVTLLLVTLVIIILLVILFWKRNKQNGGEEVSANEQEYQLPPPPP
jgi:hypothetical protein